MPLHASLPAYQDGRAPPPSVRVPRPVLASHPLAIPSLSTWCEAKQPTSEPHGAGPCMDGHLQHAEAATRDADLDIINTPPCTTPVACVPRAISGSSYVTTCDDPPSPPCLSLFHTCSTAGESSSDGGLPMTCTGPSPQHLAVLCTLHALPSSHAASADPAPVPQPLSVHCSHTPRTCLSPTPHQLIINLQQPITTFRAHSPANNPHSPSCVSKLPVPTVCRPQPLPFPSDSNHLVTPRPTHQRDQPVSCSDLCPPTVRYHPRSLAPEERSQPGTATQYPAGRAVQQPVPPGSAAIIRTVHIPDRQGTGTPVHSHALCSRTVPVQPSRHADFDAFLWGSDTSDSASSSDEEQAPMQRHSHAPASSAMPWPPSHGRGLGEVVHLSHMELPAHGSGDSGWPLSAGGPQPCSREGHLLDSLRRHAVWYDEMHGQGLPRLQHCSQSASVRGSLIQRSHGQRSPRRHSMDGACSISSCQRHAHGEMHGHAAPGRRSHDPDGTSHASSPRHYVYQYGVFDGQRSPMAVLFDVDGVSNASWSAQAASELFAGMDAACDQIQVLLQESEHYQAAYRSEQARCHALEQQLARERTTWGLERGNLRLEWCGRWGCDPVIDLEGGPLCLHVHTGDQHASAGLDAWVGATAADVGLMEEEGESEGESEEGSDEESEGEGEVDEASGEGTMDSDEGLTDESEVSDAAMEGSVPAPGAPRHSQQELTEEEEAGYTGASSSASFTSATDGQAPVHESAEQSARGAKQLQYHQECQQEQRQQQEMHIGLLNRQLSCALDTCKGLVTKEDSGLAQVLQLLQAAMATAEQLNNTT